MRNLQYLLVFICYAVTTSAQGLPNSQLYRFSIDTREDGGFAIANGRYLTSFNPEGYNNQPFLTSSGKLYYSVRMAEQDQNDIYVLDLNSEKRYRFTATSESEYSPWIDERLGKVYCIRVSDSVTPSQKMWVYPLGKGDSGHPLWNTVLEAGYFCPLSDSLMAVYTVAGDNGELHLVNIKTNTDHVLAENISRTFKPDENGDLLFLHRITDESQYLKLYETDKKTAKVLTRFENGINDFTYFDGLIWYAIGSKIMIFNPINGIHNEIADMSVYQLNDITRIFLNEKDLIIVNNPNQ